MMNGRSSYIILYWSKYFEGNKNKKKKNITVEWIDYKHVLNVIPQFWILECLKIFEIERKYGKYVPHDEELKNKTYGRGTSFEMTIKMRIFFSMIRFFFPNFFPWIRWDFSWFLRMIQIEGNMVNPIAITTKKRKVKLSESVKVEIINNRDISTGFIVIILVKAMIAMWVIWNNCQEMCTFIKALKKLFKNIFYFEKDCGICMLFRLAYMAYIFLLTITLMKKSKGVNEPCFTVNVHQGRAI